MRILFATALIAIFLGMLWGPACLVALKLARQRDAQAFRLLRVVLPGQLIAVVTLTFVADTIGLRNPAGLVVATVFGVSSLGALALFLFRAAASGTR